MHFIQPLILTTCAALLGACGSGSSNNSAQLTQARAAVSNDNASAAQVALARRGNVQCPAAIHTPAPDAGMPVDELEGVRPGLTYEEAANVIMCSNPLLVVEPRGGGFQIQQYGYKVRQGFTAAFAQAVVLKTRHQYLQDTLNGASDQLKPGEERWFVSTMGLPGKERVIAVWRDQWFAAGKNPTKDSVEQALIHKYGQPTRVTDTGYAVLCWTYDPKGSPMPNACGATNIDGDIRVNGHSGVAIQAWIRPVDKNHALARDVIVSILDDAGGYAALTATAKGLKAMDAARRAKEVQNAAKNADTPQF